MKKRKTGIFKRISAFKLSVLSGSFTGLCKRKKKNRGNVRRWQQNWWKRLQNRRKIPGLQKWYPCIKDTPVRVLARYIAWMFHREAHKRVTDHLIRQMDQAAVIYPRRYFGEENEKKHKILFEKANKRKRDLENRGYRRKSLEKNLLQRRRWTL